MEFTVLIILCSIITCILIVYKHRNDEPIKDERKGSNILFTSLNVENNRYSSEENIFKTLDEAGIEISFIENQNS